ncbi:MAG: glycerol-3-phosphate acyltransferase [Candidatus Humimicrobiia bacterium]
MLNLAIFLISYIIGSIPFSYIIAKLFKGKDIRKLGTKNVGAMNVISVAGLVPGLIALFLDILKGALTVYLTEKITGNLAVSLFAGLFTVIGHNWSIFLKFKGGKGIATAIGVLLLTSPLSVLILYLIIIPIIILITNDSFMSASIGFLIFPLILWFLEKNIWLVIFGILIAVVIIIRHLEELKTYFSGRRELNSIVEKIRNYILRKNSQKQNTHL